MIRVMLWIVCIALAGCATSPRFQTEVPSDKITGEQVCEIPQHWKALALEGVDTRSLTRAVVVQVKIPPQWIGDALGWFVEGEETHTFEHYPRYAWQALVINQRTGEKQFAPAIMKNPLTSPYLTVVITDPAVVGGEELVVYVLSGAHTKLLTVSGDMLLLTAGKDCLGMVDADFLQSYPSPGRSTVVEDIGAGARLLSGIRTDFSKPSLQSDGKVYSIHPMALTPKVAGDLRGVTLSERVAKRGLPIAIPPGVLTAVSVGVALYGASHESYSGPFGERLYSAPEAEAALGRYLRTYNMQRHGLEESLGVKSSGDDVFTFDFDGLRSGWDIGEGIASRVSELWGRLDHLKGWFNSQLRANGGATKATQPELLSSSSP